jgi:hypothetical protein
VVSQSYKTFYTNLQTCPEGKFLVTKFEFGGSFGVTLEGDVHEVEVTPNLELLVTFGMCLEGVCHELYT